MSKLFMSFHDNYTENDEYFIEHVEAPPNLRFGTKLHGGYNSAYVSLPGPQNLSQRRFRELLSSHVIIHDGYFRRVWEGRCEDAEITNEGVNLSFVGYFAHASEILHGLIYVGGTTTPTLASDIITDTMDLTAQSFGSERTWNTSDVFIYPTDIDLGYQDFSNDVRAMEAVERATRFGYKELDLRPIYFTIYNQRYCSLFPEPTTPPGFENDVDWFIPRGAFSFEGSWSLSHSRKKIWNKVWYLWDDNVPDSVGPTLSATADEDEISQKQHGIREAVINVTQVPEEVADFVRDLFVDRQTQPRQSFKGSIQGRIRHMAGMQDEPYMIKAGQLIVIDDLDMNVPLGPVVVGEGSNSAAGFVTRTEYNYARNTLQLDIGTDDKTLDMVLARWGIGGGQS